MKIKAPQKKEKGFSLIEMLLVIAIISILSSVVYGNMTGARASARDSERVTEVGQIALALELYYNNCRQYPATLDLTASNGCPSGVTLASFLSTIPEDPLNADPHVYVYERTNNAFVIRATLETGGSSLNNDRDGTLLTTDCSDTPAFYYCKGS